MRTKGRWRIPNLDSRPVIGGGQFGLTCLPAAIARAEISLLPMGTLNTGNGRLPRFFKDGFLNRWAMPMIPTIINVLKTPCGRILIIDRAWTFLIRKAPRNSRLRSFVPVLFVLALYEL